MTLQGLQTRAENCAQDSSLCPVSHAPDPVPHYFPPQGTLEARRYNKGAHTQPDFTPKCQLIASPGQVALYKASLLTHMGSPSLRFFKLLTLSGIPPSFHQEGPPRDWCCCTTCRRPPGTFQQPDGLSHLSFQTFLLLGSLPSSCPPSYSCRLITGSSELLLSRLPRLPQAEPLSSRAP